MLTGAIFGVGLALGVVTAVEGLAFAKSFAGVVFAAGLALVFCAAVAEGFGLDFATGSATLD